jgi:hypothetical protein
MADVVISTGLTVEVTVAMLFDSASGLFDDAPGLFDELDWDETTLSNTEVISVGETGVVTGVPAQASKLKSAVGLAMETATEAELWQLFSDAAQVVPFTDIDPVENDIYTDVEAE